MFAHTQRLAGFHRYNCYNGETQLPNIYSMVLYAAPGLLLARGFYVVPSAWGTFVLPVAVALQKMD